MSIGRHCWCEWSNLASQSLGRIDLDRLALAFALGSRKLDPNPPLGANEVRQTGDLGLCEVQQCGE